MLSMFIMGILAGWLLEWVFYTFYWKNRKVSGDEVVSSKQETTPAAEKASTTEVAETPASAVEEAKADVQPVAEPKQETETTEEAKADSVEEGPAKEDVAETPAKSEEPVKEEVAEEPAKPEEKSEQTSEQTDGPAVVPEKGEPVAEPEAAVEKDEPAQAELPVTEEVKEPQAASQKPDDLTKLAGIGPKVAEKLSDMGVKSYDDLANKDLDELLTNLGLAGVRINKAASQTWTKQAALAAKQDWQGVDAIKAELKK